MSNTAISEAHGQADAIERVLVQGDLSKLSAEQRTEYYIRTCQSLGLNHLTRPFDYLTLNGKCILYARKDCTEQLRTNRNVAITIVGREVVEGCYVVTARASMASGRTDESIGAVSIDGLKGEARSNAMMKAETKAKRRVTLSICGLGMLDESEADSVPARFDPPPPIHTNGRPQAIPDKQPEAPPREREPGEDDGTPNEPTVYTGSLPQITQKAILTALHDLNLAFHEPKCRTRIAEIIGREIPAAAHVSTLTVEEAGKVLAALADAKAKKAEKARKKEPAGAAA